VPISRQDGRAGRAAAAMEPRLQLWQLAVRHTREVSDLASEGVGTLVAHGDVTRARHAVQLGCVEAFFYIVYF
jgi:hypothetical protein